MTYSHLNPGDVITQAECEKILGFKRADDIDEFNLKIMGLAASVRRDLDKAGKNLTVRNLNHGVAVLTHQDAEQFNARRFNSGLHQARSAHHRQLGVRTELAPEAQRQHDIRVTKQAAILAAVNKARREVPLTPVQPSSTKGRG